MVQRRSVFPHVIDLNHQAGERIGCNVDLVYDGAEWLLIDIGFDDSVEEIVELIRTLDFPLNACQTIIATHADVDHVQGLAKAKTLLKTTATGHSITASTLETGDPIKTYAEITAQDIHLEMPTVKIERLIDDGDVLTVGNLKLEVWHTPGHTEGQLSFRGVGGEFGKLLFSGDNIYRDGCVGVIDAHHGSNI